MNVLKKTIQSCDDSLKNEIYDLFSECGMEVAGNNVALNSNFSFGELDNLNYNLSGYENETLSDVFLNWYDNWAFRKSETKGVKAFLADEKLLRFISEDDFMALISGNAFVPDEFLEVIKYKLPFAITIQKLERLNTELKLQNDTYVLNISQKDVARELEVLKLNEQKLQEIRKQEQNARRKLKNYELKRLNNKKSYEEELKDRIEKLKKENVENISPEINKRLYYLEKEALRRHEYYLQHKDEFRQRCLEWRSRNTDRLKEIAKAYRATHAEEIAEIKKHYYQRHRTKLLAKTQEWREENPEKVKENSRFNYAKNKEKRRAQNKEWVKNNPEKRKMQKANYYAAHAEELKAKSEKNRKKKRFRTKTGPKIMALLKAIADKQK